MLVQYSNGWGHATVTLATLAACVALLIFGHGVDNSVIYVLMSSVVSYWFGTSTTSSAAAHAPASLAPAPTVAVTQNAAPAASGTDTTQRLPKVTP